MLDRFKQVILRLESIQQSVYRSILYESVLRVVTK